MKRAAEMVAKSEELTDIEDLRKAQVVQIKEMRKIEDAPVDTMGCQKLADPLAPPEVFRFQVLISLMLSSQTRDQVTAAAVMRLRDHGCDADSMIKIPRPKLEELLCPVGFYKRKAEYIQKAAQNIKDNFKGDIPKTFEDKLCSLSGVGPKMAHLVMQVAWGKVEGIAVDTHVHRIVNRLGWMITKTPEETRVKLQNMLPREEWDKINPLLVGFGQQVCLPVKPHCETCLCNQLCPSSNIKKTVKSEEPETKSPKTELISPEVKSEIVSPRIKAEILSPTVKPEVASLKVKAKVTSRRLKKDVGSLEIKDGVGSSEFKKEVSSSGVKKEVGSPEVKDEVDSLRIEKEDMKPEVSHFHEEAESSLPVKKIVTRKRSNTKTK